MQVRLRELVVTVIKKLVTALLESMDLFIETKQQFAMHFITGSGSDI